MTSLYETQLDWIQKNRRRASRARSVGGLMSRLADDLADKAWAGVLETATLLAGFVDAEVRKHCRLTLSTGGRLAINVDHAGLIYSMRAKWIATLTRILVEGDSGRGVRSITFCYGQDGVSVGMPASG